MHWQRLKRVGTVVLALLAMIVTSALSVERPAVHAPIHPMAHHQVSHAHGPTPPCQDSMASGDHGTHETAIDCCSPAHCQTLLPIASLHLAQSIAAQSAPTHVAPVATPRDQELTDPPPRSLNA